MRIPKVITSKNNYDEILKDTIRLELSPIPFHIPDFQDDEKEFIKLIKKIEKLVRNSYEYKNYINFLKEEIDMNSCSFFNNLTREDISIEIHHAPLTLFEITSIVFQKQLEEYGEDGLDMFKVAEEVTKLHYKGMVGLIPLSETVHQLVHRGDVFIPIDCVYGKVYSFYKKYEKYFKEEQKNLLKNHISASKQIDKECYKPSVLERKYTFVEMDGLNLPKKINSIKEELKIS